MSKTEIETKITPQYLASRSKDQLIDLVLLCVKENLDLSRHVERLQRYNDPESLQYVQRHE